MKERKHIVKCWYCYQPGKRRCKTCKKSICGDLGGPCCSKQCKPYQRQPSTERLCWYCCKAVAVKICRICRHYVCDDLACDTCSKDNKTNCYTILKKSQEEEDG